MNLLENFSRIFSDIPYIIGGLRVTLLYSVLAVLFGFGGGIVLAGIRTSKNRFLHRLGEIYLSIFRGTPLLLQLMIICYAIPNATPLKISGFTACILAFSLNSAAYVSEIIRAGIQSVDIGQIEIARVLGCTKLQILRDIVLPQGIRNSLPALVNEMIDLIKETSLVSAVGESDLLRRATQVSASTFVYLEPLIIAGICYYVVISILGACAKAIERKFSCSK